MEHVTITKAENADYPTLTEIAFAAKRYWNYPESYYEMWCGELTISENYINENIVFKAVYNETIAGFYSIVENPSDAYFGDVFVQKGFWLEHIFVRPDYHRKGIGRFMIEHVKKISTAMGIQSLFIFVDPFARGFYDKIGAQFLHESKSSIPGRLIPVYELKIRK
jgi:maltose O-acetyltransferase